MFNLSKIAQVDFFARNCYRIDGEEQNTLSIDNLASAHRMNHLSGVFSVYFPCLFLQSRLITKREN